MSLWDEITSWLYAPFRSPVDFTALLLVTLLVATVSYAWARILDKVLEE